MNKKNLKFLFLIITITLLLLQGAFVQKAEAASYRSGDSRSTRWNSYQEWMSKSWDTIKDTRYSDMVLIGTHDSGTYNLYHYDPLQINEGLANTLSGLFKLPGIKSIIDTYMRPITKNKSECQEVNLYTQLMEGNRFFDLRFKRFNGDGQFRMFHGMFSDTIDSALRQIKDYLNDTDPREIIYINLNCFGAMWDMTTEEKEAIGRKVRDVLGSYIFTPEEFDFTMTMSQLASSGKRLVINTPSEYATTMRPTLTGYWIDQAQISSQHIAEVVIPETKKMYDHNYKYATDTTKLNRWYQMKIQVSWEQGDELKPVLDRLKNVDLIGATKKLESLLNETLRDNTIDACAEIADYMTHLGEENNANQPNIWLRDFYTKQEVAITIMRNYGQNAEERLATLETIYQRTIQDPNDHEAKSSYEFLRQILLTAGELNYQYAYDDDIMTMAPFGGHGGIGSFRLYQDGTPKRMDIRSAGRLDAIQWTFQNGSVVKAGGSGGSPQGITLENDEYITELSMCKDYAANSGHRLFFIKLVTSKGQVLMGGTPTNRVWTYKPPTGWYIAGLEGMHGSEIDSLAPIYQPLKNMQEPNVKVSDNLGGGGGTFFNFYADLPNQNAIPRLIRLRGQGRLDNITLSYSDSTVKAAGGTGGQYRELSLNKDEYIKKVNFTEAGGRIHYIRITTNHGNSVEAGSPSPNTRTIVAPEGWHVVGFYGRAGGEIDALGVITKRLPENTDELDTFYSDSIGGTGGKPFTMDINGGIPAQIALRGEGRLDAISLIYNNGQYIKAGGTGGQYADLSLRQGEYLKEIYYSTKDGRIHSARLTTNQGRSIEKGTRAPNSKTIKAPDGWYISGFFGRAEGEIDRLGVIFRKLSIAVTNKQVYLSNSFGGQGGDPYVIYNSSMPKVIGLRGAGRVDSVIITYKNNQMYKAGGNGGNYRDLQLQNGEYPTKVEYSEKDGRIHFIKISTNHSRSIEVGNRQSNTRVVTAPDGYYIAGYFGRSGGEIDRLGVIYKKLT